MAISLVRSLQLLLYIYELADFYFQRTNFACIRNRISNNIILNDDRESCENRTFRCWRKYRFISLQQTIILYQIFLTFAVRDFIPASETFAIKRLCFSPRHYNIYFVYIYIAKRLIMYS